MMLAPQVVARLGGEYWAVVFIGGGVYLYDDYQLAEKIGDLLTLPMKPQRVRLVRVTPAAPPEE